MESKKEFKTPSLGYSAFVLAALAISTFVQFKILGSSLNVTMFLNWLLMTLLAIPLGFTYDDLEKKAAENLAGVLSTLFIMYGVIDPYGHAVSETVWDKEEIIYADLDMQKVPASRMEHDVCGHYARPDVLKLSVEDK